MFDIFAQLHNEEIQKKRYLLDLCFKRSSVVSILMDDLINSMTRQIE